MTADRTTTERPTTCPVCGEHIAYIRATTTQYTKVVGICGCSKRIDDPAVMAEAMR